MPLSSWVTHTTNINLHPGAIDQLRYRHTKAEMAAFQAEESKKKLQNKLEKQAKVNRIAMLEKVLDDKLEATPCPNFKWKLCSKACSETPDIPVNKDLIYSKESKEESQVTDQDFKPTSGDDVTTTESGVETDLETPLKKKKKANKEPVQEAIKAACSHVMVNDEGTAKEGEKEALTGASGFGPRAGKDMPHVTDG